MNNRQEEIKNILESIMRKEGLSAQDICKGIIKRLKPYQQIVMCTNIEGNISKESNA